MQSERDIPPSCRFRIYLLGPFEVWERSTNDSWKPIAKDRWGHNKYPQSVLKRLLAAPGRRLPRWKLTEDLWPSFDRADKYLNNAISTIYNIIGRDLVISRDGNYELAGQAVIWVDSEVCEHVLKALDSQGAERAQAVSSLEKVLALLERGAYLEHEGGIWCHALRKQFEKLLRQCRIWLAEGYTAEGKWLQADFQYRALLQMLPPDEDALQRWMEMLAQQGKRSEALQCYEDVRQYVEAQGYTLSPALSVFSQQIEAQAVPAPRLTPAVVAEKSIRPEEPAVPVQTAVFWPLDPGQPETVLRLVAWSTLLQEEQERLATSPDVLYDVLEVEIMALALQWKPSSGPLNVLQQLAYATIRKHDAMHKQHPNHETDITRRQALQTIAMLPIQMYGLTAFASQYGTRPLPEEVLPLCAAGLTSCIELRKYEPEGMLAMQRILTVYLPTLEMISRQSSPVQSTAARLAGQGYLLVSVLAEHYSKLDQMEAACRLARFYGQLASDPNIEVASLIKLAIKFDFEHRNIASLETYQEAFALPNFATAVSPLLQGRVYSGLAGTHARCQQTAPALAFLNQARERYATVTDPTSDPGYTVVLSSDFGVRLSLWEGLTLKHTGHYAEAAEVFSRIGSLTPLPGTLETSRAEHLNYTASVAVKQRNLDNAYFYLDVAEEVAWNIQHKQRLSEVRGTFRDMQLLWPSEQKVKTLQEKLYARQW